MKLIKIGQKHKSSKNEALEAAKKLIEEIKPKRAAIAGSFLRGHLEGNDLDLVVVMPSGVKAPVIVGDYEMAINVFVTTEEAFEACVLHYAIGKAIIHLKAKAKAMGLKMDQAGVWNKEGIAVARKAKDIYKLLGEEYPWWLDEAINDQSGLYMRDKSQPRKAA